MIRPQTILIILALIFAPLTWGNDYQEAKQAMAELVQKYEANKTCYKSHDPCYKGGTFKENDTRELFLDPLFDLLGWDSLNNSGSFPYQQDTIPEKVLDINGVTRYGDYSLQIDNHTQIHIEAKRPLGDIDNPDYIFQAKRYAWGGLEGIVILTDFETFRVYDSRVKPEYNEPKAGEITEFRMSYSDYVDHFDLLWETFSKDAVAEGSLKRLLEHHNPSLKKQTVDEAFLGTLDNYRLTLGKDIHKNHPELSKEELNQATHHILDQLIFTRILEDRDIEATGGLLQTLTLWKQQKYAKNGYRSLFSYVNYVFNKHQNRYRGVIFKDHFADELIISDDVLSEIIASLYLPESPYDFSAIPTAILGKAYEHYLGKQLEIDGNTVNLALKPEVKKAGGVFYTPEWITRYIVSETLGQKLKGTSPDDWSDLKAIDLACGSGAFTIALADYLFDYARSYYKLHPESIKGKNTEFPDAYTLYDGSIKLGVKKKAELVENIIHATDVDPQAIEITKMWLYIKILEDEGAYITKWHGKYRDVPQRYFEINTNQAFSLPDLISNVVQGNILLDDELFQDQAFDVVVSNPPYMRLSKLKKFDPEQYNQLRHKYSSLSKRQPDLSYAFFELGGSLRKADGKLGFISSNSFLHNASGEALRHWFSRQPVSKIIDFGSNHVFPRVLAETSIVTLGNDSDTFKYLHLKEKQKPSAEIFSYLNNASLAKDELFVNSFERSRLNDSIWVLPSPETFENVEAIRSKQGKVMDYFEAFSAVNIGRSSLMPIGKGKPIISTSDIHRYSVPEAKYSFNHAISNSLSKKLMSPKLLVVWRSGKPQWTIDESGTAVKGAGGKGTTIIQTGEIPLKSLLGILNSSTIVAYMDSIRAVYGGGYVFNSSTTENIPLPTLNKKTKSKYKAIADNVTKRLGSTDPKEQEKLEAKIDRLVLKLYGLD